MKKFYLFLSLSFISVLLIAQTPNYSRIKVTEGATQALTMLQLGINLDNAFFIEDGSLIVEASSNELQILQENNLGFEVLIADMSKYYADRSLLSEPLNEPQTRDILSETYPVPEGFSLGSHAGFCTLEEYHNHLDNLHDTYPGLISAKMPLSETSVEGRPIYYVRIANDTVPGEKPKVLYTGMIHAREAIGMQHLLYFMYYILENYDSDPKLQYLVDHAELYLVPMVNPDGYAYNIQTNPNGGGMWRKNRKANTGGSYGVDLNRNFGYMWGYDNTGSSPTPSSDTYRGTGPFSEPETQAIRNLCVEIPFTKALNYHSYSNLLLSCWGYISSATPDNETYMKHSQIMTSDNGYTYGPASTILYNVNGGSDDWMYGDQLTKPKVFAYTPEVGSSNDGFWPAVSRIIPQCQENMYQSLMAGFLSLQYAEVKMVNPPVTKKLNNHLVFEIERLGFQDGGEYTVSLDPISENIISTGSPLLFLDMDQLEKRIDSISFSLDPAINGGTAVEFLLGVNNGWYTQYDTIQIWFGLSEPVFFDPCSNLLAWTGNWGLSNFHYVSPPSSITDSPSGNYPSSGSRTITTSNQVSIPNGATAYLRYQARWAINGMGAYVQARISVNNGGSWSPLAGEYTRPGLFTAVAGQPVYSDKQLDWVTETIDLSNYMGQNVLIRFHLYSSSWGTTTADGFYFDDIGIVSVPFTTPVNALFEANETLIMEGSEVVFSDLSAGNPDNWLWNFEGGEPLVSALQHPAVVYNSPGNYDVQLIASNDLDDDVFLANSYILVLDSILCKPEVLAGNDTIILPWETFTAIAAQAENYQSLQWTTSGDGTFDDNTLLHTTYTPGSNDIQLQQANLTLTALPVYDICSSASHSLELTIVDYTGIKKLESDELLVYPVPAKDYIIIDFGGKSSSGLIELINLTGESVMSDEISNVTTRLYNLSSFRQGIYMLRFTTGEKVHVKKILLIR
jgi:carboxypeptidase T